MFNNLFKYLSAFSLILLLVFFFLWKSAIKDLTIEKQKTIQLEKTIKDKDNIISHREELNNSMKERLNNAFNTIESNECGKEIFPNYLINLSKNIIYDNK